MSGPEYKIHVKAAYLIVYPNPHAMRTLTLINKLGVCETSPSGLALSICLNEKKMVLGRRDRDNCKGAIDRVAEEAFLSLTNKK